MKGMLTLVVWHCWWGLLIVWGYFNALDGDDVGLALVAIGGLGLIVSMVLGTRRPPN